MIQECKYAQLRSAYQFPAGLLLTILLLQFIFVCASVVLYVAS